MNALAALRPMTQAMQAWRRGIHAEPELAFKEHITSRFVAERLNELGIAVAVGLAKTGVVGTLRRGAGRSIGLRADMDALPMEENNSFAHRSTRPGCFHGCGHDGHTAMLLGAAQYLAAQGNFQGTVHFIFQPAEESQGGGRVMVEEGLFDQFPCDEIYGLHNWPSLPAGQIAVRPGPMMAATDQWDLLIEGKGGHAAFPHQTVDPVFVGTQIVQAFQGLVSRWNNPTHPLVISTTRFNAGSAYNVIPEQAKLAGTVRTLDPVVQDELERQLLHTAETVARTWGATVRFEYHRGYPATINDAECAGHAERAAAVVVGEANVRTDLPPSMGGEDFSFMLQQRPGAYLWLGQSGPDHTAGLHSSHYDFNDAVLPIGAALHVALVESRLAP